MALFSQQKFQTDDFLTEHGKHFSITFIKHANVSIDFEDFIIQVDPVTEQDKVTVDFETFPKADVILITHDHFDHLDKKAIATLSKNSTEIYCSKDVAKTLGYGNAMRPGDKVTLDNGIVIEAVCAYNISPSQMKFHPQSREDVGFIITIDGKRIYISGDIENMPELNTFKNIDIAFISVNQPYTMTIPQAVDAAKALNPKIIYPYHYSSTDIYQLVSLLSNTSIQVRIRDLQ